jgi:hypothetical protein
MRNPDGNVQFMDELGLERSMKKHQKYLSTQSFFERKNINLGRKSKAFRFLARTDIF